MKVYPCGTRVHFTALNVHAHISAFIVRFQNVEYEIVYATETERKSVWVNEIEFTTESKKQSIGFKK